MTRWLYEHAVLVGVLNVVVLLVLYFWHRYYGSFGPGLVLLVFLAQFFITMIMLAIVGRKGRPFFR